MYPALFNDPLSNRYSIIHQSVSTITLLATRPHFHIDPQLLRGVYQKGGKGRVEQVYSKNRCGYRSSFETPVPRRRPRMGRRNRRCVESLFRGATENHVAFAPRSQRRHGIKMTSKCRYVYYVCQST